MAVFGSKRGFFEEKRPKKAFFKQKWPFWLKKGQKWPFWPKKGPKRPKSVKFRGGVGYYLPPP